MSEAAAPAPSAPAVASTPNPVAAAAPNAAPVAGAPAAEVSAPSAAAARIELAKMHPDTIVVMPIDGKDVEMKASDAMKRLGRGESANKRFEEASRERAEAARERARNEAYVAELAGAFSDPAKLRRELQDLGLSPRDIAQALIAAEEAEAQMTPEQRRIRELEAAQREQQAEREAQERQAYEQERQEYRQAYVRTFQAIMAEAGIQPNTAAAAALMPSLARKAAVVQQREGRVVTKGELRQLVAQLKGEFVSLAAPDEATRRAQITDADYEAWAKAKREQRPQAAPPTRHDVRGPDGKYTPGKAQQAGQARVNANGETIVGGSLSNVWGNRM